MADNLRIFGNTYNNAIGVKMTDTNGNEVVYTAGGGLPEVGTSDIGKALLVNGSQYVSNTVVPEQTITTIAFQAVVIPNWDSEYFTVGTTLVATVTLPVGSRIVSKAVVVEEEGTRYCEFTPSTFDSFVLSQNPEDSTELLIETPFAGSLTISVSTEPVPTSVEWGAGHIKYTIFEPQELTATEEDGYMFYTLTVDTYSESYVKRPDPVNMLLVFDGDEYVLPLDSTGIKIWGDHVREFGITIASPGTYLLEPGELSTTGSHTIGLYGLIEGGSISDIPNTDSNGVLMMRNGNVEVSNDKPTPMYSVYAGQNNTVICYDASELLDGANTGDNSMLRMNGVHVESGIGQVVFYLYGIYNIYDAQQDINIGWTFIYYDMLGNKITLPCYYDSPSYATGTYTPAS